MELVDISKINRGDLFNILKESYKELVSVYDKETLIADWEKSDKSSFDNQNIGKCTIITLDNGKAIGFASWDPRNFPEFGIIGQNCVLPEYQGKGIGKKQLDYILNLFRENNCKKALVTTGDLPFFVPAQKMYLSLGFKEVSRTKHERFKYNLINYELSLK
jgi:GNAT superfamily N-acetyltransferase